MKVTPEAIRLEFIGAQAKVASSRHSGLKGLSGRIVDETRKTFTILQGSKRKMVVKDSSFFHIKFGDGTIVEFDGKLLLGRPEERLKKSIRRLW